MITFEFRGDPRNNPALTSDSHTVSAPLPPTVTAAFSPAEIAADGTTTTTLTVTLHNPNAGNVSGVTPSDTVWPAGLEPVGVTDSDCGSVAPNPATRTFSLADAYLAGTGDCAIRLQLTSTARSTALAPHRTP